MFINTNGSGRVTIMEAEFRHRPTPSNRRPQAGTRPSGSSTRPQFKAVMCKT